MNAVAHAIPKTADELAAQLYAKMKAPSDARRLYDDVQVALPSDAAALVAAASPELQRALAAYTQRRAQLVGEHGEYAETVHDREEWQAWCDKDPKTRWGAVKRHYRNGNIGLMIDDWGWTLNPKRANTGGAVRIPFRLWPRQFELVEWLWKHYTESTPAVCAKAREVGASWLAMAFSACVCVLFKNVVIGVVASTEDKLDSSKDPSPTLPKAREFLMGLPEPLRAGFDNNVMTTAPYLKCIMPETGSLIRGWTGSGDQGRGARAAMVIIDEAAFFTDEHALDASLSAVSDCLMYFSSANGTAGGFFEKVTGGAFDTFWFRIDDDPRKDAAWREAKKRVTDPVVWASEYEINFTASIDFQLFEWKWVEAAIGLLPLLESRDGFKNYGGRRAALDVSDQGKDKNCLTISEGVLLKHLYLWSGAGQTQHDTTAHAFTLLDEHGADELIYDASSPGAGIAGAAQVLNAQRRQRPITIRRFVGGGREFPSPEALAYGTDRTCDDFFANLKAFAYWGLRQRFIESWKARNGEPYDPDLVICIDPQLPQLPLLQNELAQIQRKMNATGDKLVIDKAPERAGKPRAKSPNCADSLCMLMGGAISPPMMWSDELLAAL